MVITSYQLCELDLCLSENLNLPPLSTMRESFFFWCVDLAPSEINYMCM